MGKLKDKLLQNKQVLEDLQQKKILKEKSELEVKAINATKWAADALIFSIENGGVESSYAIGGSYPNWMTEEFLTENLGNSELEVIRNGDSFDVKVIMVI